MKKLILASVAAVGLFGVAACSDTDGTTTQSIDPPLDPAVEAPQDPAMAPPPAPVDPMTPTTPAPIE